MDQGTGQAEGLSSSTRLFLILAGCGQILSLLAGLVIPLLADHADHESVMQAHLIVKIVDQVAILLLVLCLCGLVRAFKSRLWLVSLILFTLRALAGFVEILMILGIRPETQGLQLALIVPVTLSVLAAWSVLGVTLIRRRSDGERALSMTTGVVILVDICLWAVYFPATLGLFAFTGFFLWVAEAAGAVSAVISVLLACFLFGLAGRSGGQPSAVRGRNFFRLGAAGTVVIVTGLVLIWDQNIGGRAFPDEVVFTFAGLAFLGLLGAGLGYLGQSLACKGPHGLVAAVLVWLQLLLFVLALLADTSLELVWLTGLLTVAALAAGGISFLLSRKLAAPAVAVATGVVLLSCALLSLVLLIFLGDTGIDLPWRARQVLMAFAQIAMIAAYTLATVHHLKVAAGPAGDAGLPPPEEAGS